MKKTLNSHAAARRRRAAYFDAQTQRLSDVARIANGVQKDTGCSRTEALHAAEKMVK